MRMPTHQSKFHKPNTQNESPSLTDSKEEEESSLSGLSLTSLFGV
jgi:hypothetical protein